MWFSQTLQYEVLTYIFFLPWDERSICVKSAHWRRQEMKWDLQTRCYSFFHFEDYGWTEENILRSCTCFLCLNQAHCWAVTGLCVQVLLVGYPGLFVNMISVSGKVYHEIYPRRKGILQWYTMTPSKDIQVVKKCPLYTEYCRISILFSNNINLEVTLTFAKHLAFPGTS